MSSARRWLRGDRRLPEIDSFATLFDDLRLVAAGWESRPGTRGDGAGAGLLSLTLALSQEDWIGFKDAFRKEFGLETCAVFHCSTQDDEDPERTASHLRWRLENANYPEAEVACTSPGISALWSARTGTTYRSERVVMIGSCSALE